MITLHDIYAECTHLIKVHTTLHDCFDNPLHYRRSKRLLDREIDRVLTAKLMFAHELYYQDLIDIRNNDLKAFEQSKSENNHLQTKMINDYRRIIRNFSGAVRNHKALLMQVAHNRELEA